MSDDPAEDAPGEQALPDDAFPEETLPPRRRSTARGSVLGAAMLGLRDVLEGPPKDEIVIQAEAPGEPPDIDRRGLEAPLEDGSVAVGPPLDELRDKAAASRRSLRLRRRSGRRG